MSDSTSSLIISQKITEKNQLVIFKENSLIYSWVNTYDKTTKEKYIFETKNFFKFYPDLLLIDVRVEHVVRYLEEGLENKSNSSKNLSKAVISSLFNFAIRSGYLDFNPTVAIRAKRVQSKFYEKVLSLDEVKSLINSAKSEKHKLIVELFYMTGIRLSELVQIKWLDFRRYKSHYLIYIKGKGSKIRPVKITTEFYERLKVLKEEDKSYLFYSPVKANEHISQKFVTYMITKLGQKAGLQQRISAHALRHTHATHCIERGVPIQVLKASLGHTSIMTTEKYLHANPEVFSGDTLEL